MKNIIAKRMLFASLILLGLIPLANAQGMPGAIVYSVPGMDKAEVRTNIVYKKDGTNEMKLDVYMPPNLAADERRPVIFFIHGGPLGANPSPGAKEWPFYKSYGRLLAASGFVGVALDHRYVSGSPKDMETSFSDVEAAIQFIRSNAAANHVDPERVALWAFSGGGPHLSIGLRGNTPYIRCLLSFYGILEVNNSSSGSSNAPQSMEEFSPVAYLQKPQKNLPSVLIARAGLDRVAGLNAGTDLFVSKMLALGGDINLLVHPFGRHGFDGADDDDQSRDIIAAAIDFLKGRMNRPAAFEMKKEFLALLAAGNIDSAREFVRTKLNASEGKTLVNALLSEEQFTDVGTFLSGKKDLPAAIKIFEWLIELHPDSINGHGNLAYMYGISGRTDKAVAVAEKALALFATDKTLSEDQKRVGRQQVEGFLKRLRTPPSK
jgi:acetyl esterase/lipase